MLRKAGVSVTSAARAAHASAMGGVRAYHERVVDHYNNPRNVGSFDKSDPDVGTGLVGAPACGDVMKLQIKVDSETGKIVDSCFKTFGCGSAIASSSVATEWIKGKPMEEVVSIKNRLMTKPIMVGIDRVVTQARRMEMAVGGCRTKLHCRLFELLKSVISSGGDSSKADGNGGWRMQDQVARSAVRIVEKCNQ